MAALTDIISFLLQTLLSMYLFAMLLRFLLQLVRADFYNPICQFLVRVTNPLVLPLRRVIPGVRGIDLSSLLLALLLQMLLVALLLYFRHNAIASPGLLLLGGLFGIAGLLLKIYFFAIIAVIVLSWVAPGTRHPAVYLLHQITEPVMAPLRRVLPPLGGLDLSPILVFILIRVVEIALAHMANAVGVGGLVLWLF